jgi:hypothetical protein
VILEKDRKEECSLIVSQAERTHLLVFPGEHLDAGPFAKLVNALHKN